MTELTAHQAKKLIRDFLDKNQLEYTKLTSKMVDFSDLARCQKRFVMIHGWKPNPIAKEINKIAWDNDFLVQFYGNFIN